MMGMFLPGIEMKVQHKVFAEFVIRQHTFDSEFQEFFGFFLVQFFSAQFAKTTDPSGMFIIDFIFPFFPRQFYLGGVDNDAMYFGVNMRCKLRIQARTGFKYRTMNSKVEANRAIWDLSVWPVRTVLIFGFTTSEARRGGFRMELSMM